MNNILNKNIKLINNNLIKIYKIKILKINLIINKDK